MDFLENIVLSNIYGVISEREEPAAHRAKPHVNYIVAPTYQNRYELWHSRTEVLVTFNGKRFHVKPGYAVLLPKGMVTAYGIDRLAPSGFVDIYFDTPSPMPQEYLMLDLSGNLQIGALFDKIYRAWTVRDKRSRLQCFSLFYQILAELSKSLSQPSYSSAAQREKIQPGIDCINRHCFCREFDWTAPAAACGISYSYFKRIFLSVYHMPPSRYVTHMRMEQAKELLQTGKYSVGAAAEVSGYANAAYFSRVFKNNIGCSPLEFMRQSRMAQDACG